MLTKAAEAGTLAADQERTALSGTLLPELYGSALASAVGADASSP